MQELQAEKAYNPSLKKGLSFQQMYKALLADSERTELQREELCSCLWTFRCTVVMLHKHFDIAAWQSVSLGSKLQLIVLPFLQTHNNTADPFALVADPSQQADDGACALLLQPGPTSAHQGPCHSMKLVQTEPCNACAPGSSSKLGIIGQVLTLTGQRRVQ